MPTSRRKHDKQAVLRQHATLNPRPGGVTHTLFGSSEFFDPASPRNLERTVFVGKPRETG